MLKNLRLVYLMSVYLNIMKVKELVIFIFQVTDSKGHILAQNQDIGKGKFTFVTEVYDMFEVCFTSRVPPRMYFMKLSLSI